MKSKAVQRLLRTLIALVGAGIGAAAAALVLQLITLAHPDIRVSVRWLVIIYGSTCATGALVFFLLSKRILQLCIDWGTRLEQRTDKMTMMQIFACVTGLISGLIIAALLSQILNFVGTSIFTTAVSAILYVIFGALGLTIGRKRAPELAEMQDRFYGFRERRAQKKSQRLAREEGEKDASLTGFPLSGAVPKILDSSVIIDGRIFDVARTGFLEGEMLVPQFILDELQHIADSADSLRRSRGRRGLDLLAKAQEDNALRLRVDDTDWQDTNEADVKLLRLARETYGLLVTNDYNLNKVAAVGGMHVLNLNDLVSALKPAATAGEELSLTLTREGKEPGQGVGYMEDGTMIVVEGGRGHVGEKVQAVVTTVLQTSAGRMIFAKLKA